MSKALLLFVLLTVASTGVFAQAAQSQSGASTPGDSTGYATLDNHRPLIQKKEKAPTSRTLTGKVVDDTGQPLEGALVTLTDVKAHQKTTIITKKDGRYNFEDLSFTLDYEVQAKFKDGSSPTRKLSQYDHTANVVRILEIESAPESTADAKK